MVGPALIVWLLAAAPGEAARLTDAAPAPKQGCNLSNDGVTERCEKAYRYSRIAAIAVPSYVVSTDGTSAMHGMVWSLAIDVPTDDWRETFSLGVERGSSPPVSSHAFRLAFAGQVAWYPGAGMIEGRLTMRARMLSLPDALDAASSLVHLWIAGGVFGNRLGLGPRLELRLRVGHLAWGGVVIAVGMQPNVLKNYYAGDVSIGLDAPVMWWW